MNEGWKILRILTTNSCNYRCLYCHNEGQEKFDDKTWLSFDDFLRVSDIIDGMGFQEIRFSGGEPLSNKHTIDMIEWMNNNTDYEIGLATNGSLITEELAERLGKTRTLVTIHFPAVKDNEYKHVTGMHSKGLWDAIDKLDYYGVEHSFNFVLYPETINNITDVIEHVINSGKRVKLLPYIEDGFNNYSEAIVDNVKKTLDRDAVSKKEYPEGGLTTWEFKKGGKVKLLDSPCYDHIITRCREYGELRLLPDLSLQSCIFDKNSSSISNVSVDEARRIIVDMWTKFNKCLKGNEK